MRTTEGVGLVPPKPVSVRLSSSEIAHVRWLTRQRLAARGYENRADEWGRGIIGSHKAVLVGFYGEQAFSNWLLSELGIVAPVDETYRPFGDGGTDFVICNYKVQVKTATTNYDDLLIRTSDVCAPAEDGGVEWDLCVRAQWPTRRPEQQLPGLFNERFQNDRNVVDLCGLIWRDGENGFLNRMGQPVPSRRLPGVFNYVIRPQDLLPMSSFRDRCIGRINMGVRA